jgi:hypothetical protein
VLQVPATTPQRASLLRVRLLRNSVWPFPRHRLPTENEGLGPEARWRERHLPSLVAWGGIVVDHGPLAEQVLPTVKSHFGPGRSSNGEFWSRKVENALSFNGG